MVGPQAGWGPIVLTSISGQVPGDAWVQIWLYSSLCPCLFIQGCVLSPSVLVSMLASKKTFECLIKRGCVWEGETDRGSWVPWDGGSVFCLQKDGDLFFSPLILFFRGCQLALAGVRGDIKRKTERNNQGFSGIRSNIDHILTAACWHLSHSFHYLSVCFYPLFIYSSLAFRRCWCRSAALGRRVQYCVSIEPFLMNLLRKLKYCRTGRWGSLSLMHGDRWSIGGNNL